MSRTALVTVMDSLDPHLHATTRNLQAVWPRIRFVRGDMRDETLLADIVQGQDVIFNCAAQTSHPLSIQYPTARRGDQLPGQPEAAGESAPAEQHRSHRLHLEQHGHR
jgi:hypothetical protein